MKRTTVILAALALAAIAPAEHGQAEFNVNVNIGIPVVAQPQVILEEPPEFIFPGSLGFYVAVGVPYDLFLFGSNYYLYRDGGWYLGGSYSGPWVRVEYRQLPPGLRKHKHEKIRRYRDEEYKRYRSDRDNYRGRYYRPVREMVEERRDNPREEREQRREERRDDRRMDREDHRHGGGEGHGRGRHGDKND